MVAEKTALTSPFTHACSVGASAVGHRCVVPKHTMDTAALPAY
jgi:hypothetical protein